MQLFIGLIAISTTVIHLTLGCCMHGGCCAQIAQGGDSSKALPAVETTLSASTPVKRCCRCHRARPRADVTERDGGNVGGNVGGEQSTGKRIAVDQLVHDHACHGCLCAAIRNAKVAPPELPLLASIDTALGDHHAPSLRSEANHLSSDPFAYAGLRPHSVFGRFLI